MSGQVSRRVVPEHQDAAQRWAQATLGEEWGLRSSLGRAWVPFAQRADGECTLTLEYDDDAHLLAVELWQDGQRLFGLDDWVG
jgi:hypothetical protein